MLTKTRPCRTSHAVILPLALCWKHVSKISFLRLMLDTCFTTISKITKCQIWSENKTSYDNQILFGLNWHIRIYINSHFLDCLCFCFKGYGLELLMSRCHIYVYVRWNTYYKCPAARSDSRRPESRVPAWALSLCRATCRGMCRHCQESELVAASLDNTNWYKCNTDVISSTNVVPTAVQYKLKNLSTHIKVYIHTSVSTYLQMSQKIFRWIQRYTNIYIQVGCLCLYHPIAA